MNTQKTLFLFFFQIFLTSSVFAIKLECPLIIPNELLNLTKQECSLNNYNEILPKDRFQRIGTYFQRELTKAYTDTITPPSILTKKLIHLHRQYRECLYKVCENMESTCRTKGDANKSSDFIYNWCNNTAAKLVSYQKTKINYLALQNQANKQIARIQAKFDSIGERFMNHIEERYINVLNQTERFEAKVNALILYPKKKSTVKFLVGEGQTGANIIQGVLKINK